MPELPDIENDLASPSPRIPARRLLRVRIAGRLRADRALSRLLRGDWPRTLAELEARRGARV